MMFQFIGFHGGLGAEASFSVRFHTLPLLDVLKTVLSSRLHDISKIVDLCFNKSSIQLQYMGVF